jgi:hypothetical protein
MTNPAQKKQCILDHERTLANKLAVRIFDKPKPPLWMIFVPIFFVFFAQKIRQYQSGLEDFVDNYLKARKLAMEAALECLENDSSPDVDAMLEKAGDVPEHARPEFSHWMHMLVDHYRTLLSGSGSTPEALVRSGYRTKTDYLLLCNALNKAENAFSLALMPDIEGDSQDIGKIIARINESAAALRREEADSIYP